MEVTILGLSLVIAGFLAIWISEKMINIDALLKHSEFLLFFEKTIAFIEVFARYIFRATGIFSMALGFYALALQYSSLVNNLLAQLLIVVPMFVTGLVLLALIAYLIFKVLL